MYKEYCEKYCQGYKDTGGKCFCDGECDDCKNYRYNHETNKKMQESFTEKINNMSQEEFDVLMNDPEIKKYENVGPTVDEYMSQFKVIIVDEYHLGMFKELISFYRYNHNPLTEAASYNLDDLEKMCNTAVDLNEFRNT